jgi:hypothetical protein
MSPSDETTAEARRPAPTVEQRLRYLLATTDCLRRIAIVADEPHGIPLFNDLRRFADLVHQFAWATETHVLAIKAALSVSCANIDAPDAEAETGGQS